MIDLNVLDLIHVHLVRLPPDETVLVDDPTVSDRDFSDPPVEPLLNQENDRGESEGVAANRQILGRNRFSPSQ